MNVESHSKSHGKKYVLVEYWYGQIRAGRLVILIKSIFYRNNVNLESIIYRNIITYPTVTAEMQRRNTHTQPTPFYLFFKIKFYCLRNTHKSRDFTAIILLHPIVYFSFIRIEVFWFHKNIKSFDTRTLIKTLIKSYMNCEARKK